MWKACKPHALCQDDNAFPASDIHGRCTTGGMNTHVCLRVSVIGEINPGIDMCRQTLRIGMDIGKQAQIDGIWLTWITYMDHKTSEMYKFCIVCQSHENGT